MTLFLPREVVLDGALRSRVREIGGTLDMLGTYACLADDSRGALNFEQEYARTRAERVLYQAGGWGHPTESLYYQPRGCALRRRGHHHAFYTVERPITCAPAAPVTDGGTLP